MSLYLDPNLIFILAVFILVSVFNFIFLFNFTASLIFLFIIYSSNRSGFITNAYL